MQCSMASQDIHRNVAAVLLSEPHFIQVTSCSPNTQFIAYGCSASASHIMNHTLGRLLFTLPAVDSIILIRDDRILELDAGVSSGSLTVQVWCRYRPISICAS